MRFWLTAILLLPALPLLAHHSFGAEYDTSKPVTLTGVVTKIEWANPHTYFYVDARDDQGNIASWKLEGYPPGVLYRTGWKRNVTMKPGDTVKFFGWQARDETHAAHSREVTLADGRKLYSGPPAGTGGNGRDTVPDIVVAPQ